MYSLHDAHQMNTHMADSVFFELEKHWMDFIKFGVDVMSMGITSG
jgi:hypothetical protein